MPQLFPSLFSVEKNTMEPRLYGHSFLGGQPLPRSDNLCVCPSKGAFTHYEIQPDFLLKNIGPLFSQLLFSIVLMVTG